MDDEVKDPLEAMDEEDAEDDEIDPDKLGPGLHIEGEDEEVDADVDGETPTDIDDPLMFDPLIENKKTEKKKSDNEDEEEEFPEEEEDAEIDLVDEDFEHGEEW